MDAYPLLIYANKNYFNVNLYMNLVHKEHWNALTDVAEKLTKF